MDSYRSELAEGLASRAEVDRLVHDLCEFARDPDTVVSGPVWYKPGATALADGLRVDEIVKPDKCDACPLFFP